MKNMRLSMSMATEPSIADKICNNFIISNTIRRYNAKGQPVFMVAALGIILD
jgi:hypothetical protein